MINHRNPLKSKALQNMSGCVLLRESLGTELNFGRFAFSDDDQAFNNARGYTSALVARKCEIGNFNASIPRGSLEGTGSITTCVVDSKVAAPRRLISAHPEQSWQVLDRTGGGTVSR